MIKKTLSILVIVASVLVYGSCASNTDQTQTASDLPQKVLLSDTLAADTTQENEQPVNKSITGEVKEIEQGKDGYTAKLVTTDNQTYFVTVSHANLRENAAQYRAVNVGETITVTGDVWQMGEQTRLTVRSLK